VVPNCLASSALTAAFTEPATENAAMNINDSIGFLMITPLLLVVCLFLHLRAVACFDLLSYT
jgi:hypothetical protein